MKVQVLFFGELRETVGTPNESVELAEAITVAHLIDQLAARGEPWQSALMAADPLRVAVNQEMANLDTPLADGVEVAFFRPVTGG